ncbi:hypothetical protein FEM41_05960 [Jejubacter calystegiae]|uniref:DUF3592 domain-containing protein n=1 Tax=Jejubacter calystegiae TaxID=2579935 RepID=A0A4P8YH14_9ENTR|nr:hypothetical protein [Jejubacter calystegiae]QCT19233.1 hypothetical protein FEM41_05960 [Jejubacter calystegiae]
MKEFVVIFIVIVFFAYIGREFYSNIQIDKKGKESIAIIIKSKQISSNTGGSINGEFLVSFINDENKEERVLFQETIPQLYASRVQPGEKIKIKYMKKKNKTIASFVFD